MSAIDFLRQEAPAPYAYPSAVLTTTEKGGDISKLRILRKTTGVSSFGVGGNEGHAEERRSDLDQY